MIATRGAGGEQQADPHRNLASRISYEHLSAIYTFALELQLGTHRLESFGGGWDENHH